MISQKCGSQLCDSDYYRQNLDYIMSVRLCITGSLFWNYQYSTGDGGGGHWLVRMEWHHRMVSVSASVNPPLQHKVQKFSSGTGSPGLSRKKGCKMVVCVHVSLIHLFLETDNKSESWG